MSDVRGSNSDPFRTKKPIAIPLSLISISGTDYENELIKSRFLCRGGALLFVGPTGIGKSTFILQMMIGFALGKEQFGLIPSKALRILIIQSENDDGDLVEMRNGAMKGLALTLEEAKQATDNIHICSENERTSKIFADNVVKPLLEEIHPDLVVIDPALGYLGGDMIDQKIVGAFLRESLSPYIKEYKCGLVIVHHTNKTSNTGTLGDAYFGAGSAEWGNWARAVINLIPAGNGMFKLRLAKRGARVGWKQSDGMTVSLERFIEHSKDEGVLFWRECHDATSSFAKKPKSNKVDERKGHIIKAIPSGGIEQNCLVKIMNEKSMGLNTCHATIKLLCEEGILLKTERRRADTRPEIILSKSENFD